MWKAQWKWLVGLTGGFLLCYYLPVGTERFNHAVMESLELVKWYAREHVLLCLVPAFFIAGGHWRIRESGRGHAILGAKSEKVDCLSGCIRFRYNSDGLFVYDSSFVCRDLQDGSGTWPGIRLSLFRTGHQYHGDCVDRPGAGNGNRNRRAVGAIGLSVVIGGCMHLIFRREELEKARMTADLADTESGRPLWQNVLFIGSMIAILVFANLGKSEDSGALWMVFWRVKWYLTSLAALVLGFMLIRYYGMKWWKTGVYCRSSCGAGLSVPGQTVAGVHGGISRSRGIYKHRKRGGTPKLV